MDNLNQNTFNKQLNKNIKKAPFDYVSHIRQWTLLANPELYSMNPKCYLYPCVGWSSILREMYNYTKDYIRPTSEILNEVRYTRNATVCFDPLLFHLNASHYTLSVNNSDYGYEDITFQDKPPVNIKYHKSKSFEISPYDPPNILYRKYTRKLQDLYWYGYIWEENFTHHKNPDPKYDNIEELIPEYIFKICECAQQMIDIPLHPEFDQYYYLYNKSK